MIRSITEEIAMSKVYAGSDTIIPCCKHSNEMSEHVSLCTISFFLYDIQNISTFASIKAILVFDRVIYRKFSK